MDLMAYVPVPMKSLPMKEVEAADVVHRCSQTAEQLQDVLDGASFLTKLRRCMLYKRTLSASHPFAQWWIKSKTAIDYETSRHIASFSHMIHPFSVFRIYWETAMLSLNFLVLLLNPLYLAFYSNEQQYWYPSLGIAALDMAILCDVLVNFLTGYYDHRMKSVVLDAKVVASKYVKSTFLLDVLSALPFHLIDFLISNRISYCTTLNLLKIVRMRVVITYSRTLRHVYKITYHRYKLAKTSMIVVITVHWAACLQYYIPSVIIPAGIYGSDRRSWIYSDLMLKKTDTFEKYLLCLNRATIALVCSSHYLDVNTPEDIILNVGLSVLGSLGFIYILVQMMQLMTTLHLSRERRSKGVQQLREYMSYKELPRDLQRRLLLYYDYRKKKGFDRYQRIVAQVSPYLQQQLVLQNYVKFIDNVEMLRYIPRAIVTRLASLVRAEIFLENDIIVKAGVRASTLFYVASGTVAVYNRLGKEVCHLEDGTYFGEVALIMESEYRIVTVVAVETCEVYTLNRTDFQHVMQRYPNLLVNLQKIAFERLDRTLVQFCEE